MRCKKGRDYEIDQKNYCLCIDLEYPAKHRFICSGYRSNTVEQEYPAHINPSQKMLADLEQKGVQIKHVKDSSLITNVKNPSNGKLSFTI